MKFSATEEQLREVAALAYNASQPMGMGFLHYRPGDVKGSDLGHIDVARGLDFDYVQGRMMKLSIFKVGDHFETPAEEPRSDYQSWARRYPTYEALLAAAGITVTEQARTA